MQDMTTNQSNLTVPTEPEQASSQFLIGFMIFKCISIVVGVLGNHWSYNLQCFYEQGKITDHMAYRKP